MIKSLTKKLTFPILKSIYTIYSSKERNYSYNGIKVKIFPGVFHPGLFFSTKLLIEYVSELSIKDKKVLELGAGSGLISIYCAKQKAVVTATDISAIAIENIKLNTLSNNVSINIIKSDLFDEIEKQEFDFIIINPPYFPKDPKNESESAWFCGSDFQYFKKLFSQLNNYKTNNSVVLMILSEDCDISRIKSIAEENNFNFSLVFQKKVLWEENFIYRID
jgi:release factor glutamine methyltransferase